jgi:predicted DNA-binding protein with PD1-like motif
VRARAALALLVLSGCVATSPPETRSFLVRLKPGQELKTELTRLAHDNGLRAATVTSAVGSLTDVALRLANKEETTRWQGHFEVVSLSGYLADGEFHLHMAVSDGDGRTIGGHVMEGNRVYTTLVIAVEEHLRFDYRREFDPASGYAELVIERR